MSTHPFTLTQFMTHPLLTCAFLMLIVTTISFWVYKRLWVWGPLLIASCGVAFLAKALRPTFLIPVSFLFIAHWILKTDIRGLSRFLTGFIATILSLALAFHFIPDVSNWLLVTAAQVSPNAPAFDYYWNFDKPFIGFFILGFQLRLIGSREEFRSIILKSSLFFLFVLALFIFASLTLNVLEFDFKLPLLGLAWLVGNLFFTVIPEEVFFRGFLQKQISQAIPHVFGPYLANLLVSLGFGLVHFFFISSATYVAFSFVASFLYGLIFHLTKSIESSIFCHYALNVIHFIFFTYPILTSAM